MGCSFSRDYMPTPPIFIKKVIKTYLNHPYTLIKNYVYICNIYTCQKNLKKLADELKIIRYTISVRKIDYGYFLKLIIKILFNLF